MRRGCSGDYAHNSRLILLSLLVCIIVADFYVSSACAAEKWAGVDEAVVERIARDHGREKKDPFINTDQGDLLLFVFLTAGAVGGFAAGYFWRIILVERSPKAPKKKETFEG